MDRSAIFAESGYALAAGGILVYGAQRSNGWRIRHHLGRRPHTHWPPAASATTCDLESPLGQEPRTPVQRTERAPAQERIDDAATDPPPREGSGP